jgi:hypothetical protein
MIAIKQLKNMADIVRDPSISLKAKGVYSVMLCFQEVEFSDLVNMSRDGEVGTLTAVRELLDLEILEMNDEKAKVEEDIPEWALRVFEEWMSHPSLIRHRVFSMGMYKRLKGSKLTEDQAVQAIKNYVYVLEHSEFFKFKWTFDQFFERERGARLFVNRDVILKQYCNKIFRKQQREQVERRPQRFPENDFIKKLTDEKVI